MLEHNRLLMVDGDPGPHNVAREVPMEGMLDAETKSFEAGVGEGLPESETNAEESTN